MKITNEKLKVAAYCRVSTKSEMQKKSIETQIGAYKTLISGNAEWDFAGIYLDYGSGLRVSGRKGFLQMIQDAADGKIDLIITKSISRFSRNTVDLLETLRKLKKMNVEVYFEVENIHFTGGGQEFLISVLGAFAQDEIFNMSKNIQWGYRRKFERGDIFMKYKNFYGYDFVDGEMVIVPEQAEIIKRIFHWYAEGDTLKEIKHRLEEAGVKTATGKSVWSEKVILGMLSNEKYVGDSLLQKTYTVDHLSGKRRKNNGEITRYYVRDSHPGIISRGLFYKVQEEMKKRARSVIDGEGYHKIRNQRYNKKNLLGNLLECAVCGAAYRRRTERGKVVYRCATRIEKGRDCCKESVTLKEDDVKRFLQENVCSGDGYDEKIIRKFVLRLIVSKDGGIEIVWNENPDEDYDRDVEVDMSIYD
ncbi:MAG: recombinase family protein [Anaerotignum sp.]|jgi:site-specific DNA recombinase|nr:recombinase family protein [Anaerotignum sp.]MCI8868904.1 recombinase family protein [Anaerotignum sp.]